MKENKDFVESILQSVLNSAVSESNLTLLQLFENKLKENNLTSSQVESFLAIDKKSLYPILTGTAKQPDAIKILKIADFLEVNADFILKLFLKEASPDEIGKLDNARRANFIFKNFDLKILKKQNFFQSIDNLVEVEKRICQYFGLVDIYDYNKDFNKVLYSRSRKKSSNKMLDFWVKSALVYFKSIVNPNKYDRDALKELIPKIRPYTTDVENGLVTVFQALYNVGVTIIYQPYLPNTQVRGATFVIDNKPHIAITDFLLSYPTLWFALIHELYHVLYDLENIQNTSYHLTGEPDLFLIQEEKANEFAAELLFPTERMNFIKPFIFEPKIVENFAKESQVHESIIYRLFQFKMEQEGKNYWGAFQQSFPKTERATAKLNKINWSEESVKENSIHIKQILQINS